MSEGIDINKIPVGSYRFSGYKLDRDHNGNIVRKIHPIIQPEYWKTRAVTLPQGFQPYDTLEKK